MNSIPLDRCLNRLDALCKEAREEMALYPTAMRLRRVDALIQEMLSEKARLDAMTAHTFSWEHVVAEWERQQRGETK